MTDQPVSMRLDSDVWKKTQRAAKITGRSASKYTEVALSQKINSDKKNGDLPETFE